MQVIRIFILSLLCSPLFGQAGASMMMVTAESGDTYLLDDYPADAAYSLRLLAANQIDSAAIRVRRSSDNAEQDIGFTSEGYLDTASLKTFVGANSGYVVTWYDQSGNENDATQATASNQPRIVNSGIIERENGYPTIVFANSPSQSYFKKSFTLGNPVSGFIVAKFNSSGDFLLDALSSTNVNSLYTTTTTDIRLYNTSSGFTQSMTLGQRYLFSFHSNGASSYIGVNNIYASGTVGTASMNGITIGASASNSLGLAGSIQELIIYNSNQYTNRASIDGEINNHYSIY